MRCSQRILGNYNNVPSTSGICFAHFSTRKAMSYNISYFKLFYINPSQHREYIIPYCFMKYPSRFWAITFMKCFSESEQYFLIISFYLFVCVNLRTRGICINCFSFKIGSNESSSMVTLSNLWLQVSMLSLPFSTKYILPLAHDTFPISEYLGIHFISY